MLSFSAPHDGDAANGERMAPFRSGPSGKMLVRHAAIFVMLQCPAARRIPLPQDPNGHLTKMPVNFFDMPRLP
jgi:hypothetical protein